MEGIFMDILNDSEVIKLRESLRQNAEDGNYIVSDLIFTKNGRTYQLVDLVMEGGGTLGIALAGYIYALEQADIRFLSVGGSSVGAIAALLLSCIGDRTEEKGAELAAIIADMDMASFVDGGLFSGAFCRLLGSGGAGEKKLCLLLLGILSSPALINKLGLNPGDKFFSWLTDTLERNGINTLADACRVYEKLPPNLKHRIYGTDFKQPEPKLKLVTTDLTTGSKVVFPEMAPLYWEYPDYVNPALFARASMSIPGFFRPMEVTGVSGIKNAEEKWENLCSFAGEIPDRITFADGGLLSNFPISLFHVPRVPHAPTFGARLGSKRRDVREINTLTGYAGGMFSAMRHSSDYDFIYHHPDYRRLITYIPTSGHSWLNFAMTDEEKLTLFKKGMRAAAGFIESFDWAEYKEIRFALIKAHSV